MGVLPSPVPTLLQDIRVIDNDAYNYFTYHLNHGRCVLLTPRHPAIPLLRLLLLFSTSLRPYPCNNYLTNHCTNITPTLVDQTTYDLPLSPLHPTPYDHVSVIKLDFSSDIDANLLLFRGSTAFEAWVKGTVLSLTCYMIHDVFDQ